MRRQARTFEFDVANGGSGTNIRPIKGEDTREGTVLLAKLIRLRSTMLRGALLSPRAAPGGAKK